MIDVHSHIIHGVDDGPSSIEESLRMVEVAEKLGIRTIIATPHFHENIFGMERVEENYQELLYKSKAYEVDLKKGFEVFVDPSNSIITRSRKKLTLNQTGHILIEFPLNANPVYCLDAIKNLQLENILPVIAHPERNREFQKKFGSLVNFIKSRCMIQIDAASIAGIYGIRVKEFARELIKMNFADIVASNAHYALDYSEWYLEAYKNVVQWVGLESAYKLFYSNAKKILDGAEESKYKVIGSK
jgi:protein-tyrosine phosphatase